MSQFSESAAINPAYVIVPHRGGTFSVYASLCSGFQAFRVKLDWVGVCSYADKVLQDSVYSEVKESGVLFSSSAAATSSVGSNVLAHIAEKKFNVVFINILTTPLEMSLAAFLPSCVMRVGIVHNITPGTYSAAKALRPYLHAAVGVSPRIREHLVNSLGYKPETTFVVPNAIELSPYQKLESREPSDRLRILSLGRIVDTDKGVFWLPEILRHLREVPFHLTVAGDGADLSRLKQLCSGFGDRVTFMGRVDPSMVPSIMAKHDVFLMPSRFEGFGYTLIEAMAARCVPVASRIRGVTDFIVEHGRTGLLFPMGDTKAAAAEIRKLAAAATLRDEMGRAGRDQVTSRFSAETMGRSYMEVVRKIAAHPASVAPPPTREFSLVPIGGGWRRYVPAWLKNTLRTWMYRS